MKLYSEFEVMVNNVKRQLAEKTNQFSNAMLGQSAGYAAHLFYDAMTLKFKVEIYRSFEPIARSIYNSWLNNAEWCEKLLNSQFCQAIADHGINSLQMADQYDDTTIGLFDMAMDQWRKEMDEMIDRCGIRREI